MNPGIVRALEMLATADPYLLKREVRSGGLTLRDLEHARDNLALLLGPMQRGSRRRLSVREAERLASGTRA